MASEIKVDTISEKTSANGVAIDGLTIKDGGLGGHDITFADGAYDFDIASHDTSNGLKLGGTLVTATAAELNIMDGVTSTAAELNIMDGVTSTAVEINLIDGGTARGTTAIADGDGVLINDAGTMRMTTVETLSTYIGGFDVSSITGATALAVTPAATDEMVISDAGTLKRLDMTHMMTRPVFSATRNSAQTLNDDAVTKIQYDVELVDSDACYDKDTNYRFTPTVAGTYLIIHKAYCNKGSDSTINSMSAYIYKNGSNFGYSGTNFAGNPARASNMTNTVIMDLDDDDYVEAYAHCNTTSGTVDLESSTATPLSVFMGFKLATT